jgi:hypothetical protein
LMVGAVKCIEEDSFAGGRGDAKALRRAKQG